MFDKNHVVIFNDEEKLPRIIDEAAACGATIILEFGASWCKNCKKVSPLIKQLVESSETQKGVVVLDIDIDDCEELAGQYGVSSIPRYIILSEYSMWEYIF